MRQLEFGLTGFYPAFEGAKRARLAEDMGFDIHGFSENHSRAPDCFGEMRDAARQTSRIKLACGPVNFVTRNPGVVASAVVPLQILSGSRVICNIASGDSAVAAAGLKSQRILELERDLGYLRAYLEGDDARFANGTSRLEWAANFSWDPVPIQVSCSGPKAIALAARKADRICLGIGTNVDHLTWALRVIDEGLAESGRDRNSIRIGLFVPLAIAADRSAARSLLRERGSAWAHMQSGRGIDLAQQPEILRRVTAVLRENYDYKFHRPGVPLGTNPNAAACDDEFADWIGIGGPPPYVVDRLGKLVEMGIDFFITSAPIAEREKFAVEVMPVLRKLRH